MTVKASTGFTPISYTTDRPLDPRDEYGGIGDGAPHPLSSRYSSLAEAQIRYPHATALTDEIDWCALQGVINDSVTAGSPATVTRNGKRDVLIAAGDWVLNRPLAVESVLNFSMRGLGKSTRLRLSGDALTCMLDLNGTAHSTFSDFNFASTRVPATNSCTCALWVRRNGTNRSSTENTFANIEVREINYTRAGVEVGENAVNGQVDNTKFTGVSVTGDARWHQSTGTSANAASFYVGTGTAGNNLIHSFYGCVAILNAQGLFVDNTAPVSWFGGSIQTMWNSDLFMRGQSFLTVDNTRSEGSSSILRTGNASLAAFASLSNYWFNTIAASLAANRQLIAWQYGGSLVLENLYCTNPTALPITINGSPGSGAAVVTSTGVAIQGRTMAQAFVMNVRTTNRVISYVDVDNAGVTTGVESNLTASTPVNVTITGTGAQTVFTVTHNLALTTPFLPSSITVLDPGGNILSGSSYALSAPTANNFTVTFAVAPANAAVHTFRVTA